MLSGRLAALPLIDGDDVSRLLDFGSLIAALEAGHRSGRMDSSDVIIGRDSARYFVRSTGAPGATFGSKLVTVIPGNEERTGLPAVQGLVILFDGRDGRPLALLDGTEITYWKTAADSALGSKLLARHDARSLLMVGAGSMAPWLIRAHLAVRPDIDSVSIWNRTRARAEALAARLAEDGIAAEVSADLPEAVSRADIISTATMAREPLIEGAWLRPGCHLDLVGGWTPEMREADDAAMARARIFVDSRASAFDGVGDILTPIASGAITADDVLGDFYDLVGGAAGRTGEDDITVLKNAGGAHLDLMTAEAVLRRFEAETRATS